MKLRAILVRLSDNGFRTLGRMIVFDGVNPVFSGVTLEPPWKENKTKQSCIPSGKYNVIPRNPEKFGNHFMVENVPGRDGILFHPMNLPSETQGCIGIGVKIDDGETGIMQSRIAMQNLLRKAPNGFSLEIIGTNG